MPSAIFSPTKLSATNGVGIKNPACIISYANIIMAAAKMYVAKMYFAKMSDLRFPIAQMAAVTIFAAKGPLPTYLL